MCASVKPSRTNPPCVSRSSVFKSAHTVMNWARNTCKHMAQSIKNPDPIQMLAAKDGATFARHAASTAIFGNELRGHLMSRSRVPTFTPISLSLAECLLPPAPRCRFVYIFGMKRNTAQESFRLRQLLCTLSVFENLLCHTQQRRMGKFC